MYGCFEERIVDAVTFLTGDTQALTISVDHAMNFYP